MDCGFKHCAIPALYGSDGCKNCEAKSNYNADICKSDKLVDLDHLTDIIENIRKGTEEIYKNKFCMFTFEDEKIPVNFASFPKEHEAEVSAFLVYLKDRKPLTYQRDFNHDYFIKNGDEHA